jgi:radical SAM enzyme (TIGR01210 family)
MVSVPSRLASGRERDRFVLAHRPARPLHDPWRHQGLLVEEERAGDGTRATVATIFLTGRECPWRCVMCDLWQHTIERDTPRGALVRQLDDALATVARDHAGVTTLKLYNAGSFFDPHAVPVQDYEAIAARVARFARVIVESHPALVGARLARFYGALVRASRDAPVPRLEVALGLETAHPEALRRLGKRVTLDRFREAARRARQLGADVRVFLLVGMPFIPRPHQREWIARSIAEAFDFGASVVSLIPTRSGNGALETLERAGLFERPSLADVEHALERALPSDAGRVFVDLWDLQALATCLACFDARRERLRIMNLEQRVLPPVPCARCTRTFGAA